MSFCMPILRRVQAAFGEALRMLLASWKLSFIVRGISSVGNGAKEVMGWIILLFSHKEYFPQIEQKLARRPSIKPS